MGPQLIVLDVVRELYALAHGPVAVELCGELPVNALLEGVVKDCLFVYVVIFAAQVRLLHHYLRLGLVLVISSTAAHELPVALCVVAAICKIRAQLPHQAVVEPDFVLNPHAARRVFIAVERGRLKRELSSVYIEVHKRAGAEERRRCEQRQECRRLTFHFARLPSPMSAQAFRSRAGRAQTARLTTLSIQARPPRPRSAPGSAGNRPSCRAQWSL